MKTAGIVVRHPNFISTYCGVNARNVGAFNQEKALVGAFSVIVQLRRLIVYSTSPSHMEVETILWLVPQVHASYH